MPSKQSQRFFATLEKRSPLVGKIGDRVMNINPSGKRVADLPILGTKGHYFTLNNIPSLRILPQQLISKEVVLLHCHGGAYVSGNLLQARAVASYVSSVSNLKTYTFAYRLAPQYPFPAQLEDALILYHHLLNKGYAPENIGLVGESAGGNLALAITLHLKSLGLPLPGALVLLSPWTDLTLSGESYTALQSQDVTLNFDFIKESAYQFTAQDENLFTNPIVSPIFADFTGFPPTQIHVGTRELLLSDGEELLKVMKRDEVNVCLLRWKGMPHVFQVYGFPESRSSMRSIGDFLKDILVHNCR